MTHRSLGRRGLAALAAVLGLAACAPAPAARAEIDIPRMDPDHCTGQPVIRPLQPLVIDTARGPAKFMVEMAVNDRERSYGLMCRKALAPNRGMLFDFGEPEEGVNFWMRNTLIGLDIIYIAPNGRIVSIARQARPLDETPLPAGGVVRGVLEIAGGRAAQLGIEPGDKVESRIFAP